MCVLIPFMSLISQSGRYLAAEVDHDTTFDPMRQKLRGTSDIVYHLTVDHDDLEPVHTIFELDPTTIQKSNQMVPRYLDDHVCGLCMCVRV